MPVNVVDAIITLRNEHRVPKRSSSAHLAVTHKGNDGGPVGAGVFTVVTPIISQCQHSVLVGQPLVVVASIVVEGSLIIPQLAIACSLTVTLCQLTLLIVMHLSLVCPRMGGRGVWAAIPGN